jgi:uncharacterized protein (DUF697 family)
MKADKGKTEEQEKKTDLKTDSKAENLAKEAKETEKMETQSAKTEETMKDEKMEKQAEETSVNEVTNEDVDRLIRRHVYVSMAVGLIPLPLADFAGLTLVQLNLLRKLAQKYNVPFSNGLLKNILSSVVGGAVPTEISGPLAVSIAKIVPAVGMTAGVVTMPIVGGASTYAVGKVFVQHFASGGTFLTFDPEKVRDYYAEMFKEGEKVAAAVAK